MALQRMLKLAAAAEIAGMHPNQLRIEIKAGRLRAKRSNSPRGKGKLAHYLIPEGELKRYLDNLPDALEPATSSPVPTAPGGGGPAVSDEPVRKRQATKGGADWV